MPSLSSVFQRVVIFCSCISHCLIVFCCVTTTTRLFDSSQRPSFCSVSLTCSLCHRSHSFRFPCSLPAAWPRLDDPTWHSATSPLFDKSFNSPATLDLEPPPSVVRRRITPPSLFRAAAAIASQCAPAASHTALTRPLEIDPLLDSRLLTLILLSFSPHIQLDVARHGAWIRRFLLVLRLCCR